MTDSLDPLDLIIVRNCATAARDAIDAAEVAAGQHCEYATTTFRALPHDVLPPDGQCEAARLLAVCDDQYELLRAMGREAHAASDAIRAASELLPHCPYATEERTAAVRALSDLLRALQWDSGRAFIETVRAKTALRILSEGAHERWEASKR